MSLTDRMVRAARLDASLYEEVEADPTLTGQALAVVLISAAAAGIGGAARGPGGLLSLAVAALAAWYVWALLTFWIGARLLPEAQTKADLGQLLRTIGFASAPGTIRVLGLIPGLANLAFAAGQIWMLVAMVVAVRQALDYASTWRAFGVVVIGWTVQALIGAVMLGLLRV